MKSLLIRNIKLLAGTHGADVQLVRGADMKVLPSVDDAYLLVEDGIIKAFGSNTDTPERADETIDAKGGMVLPAWCDSHTHLVFAAPREKEFVDKINGLTYEQIAQRGGGILNSAKALANTSEEELFDSAWHRLMEIQSQGTGAVEIKSGYGLSYEGELKMLRVISKLKEKSKLTIKATFLGAHAFPTEYKQDHEGYLALLLNKLLPQIAYEGLADFIDAFCETGYFSVDETKRIIEAGAKYNLPAKIHVNQFNITGGVQACTTLGARSVDHLEVLDDNDIAALKNSNTMPVALPGCSMFIRIPYTPARTIIDNGLPLAIASDFNPGTCPTGNMNMILSLACINLRMLPEEAINAATINGAYAMDVADTLGSISIGKKANLIITKPVPSLAYLPYAYGSNNIERVVIS
ncbi:MAG: imidazolonepropionase [Bacteroidetes bacterium]|nr:imidazolonepropionase [Bacteroidota bacterium]